MPDIEEAVREEFNRMRGQICGFIEAVGLPERQEKGAIRTFKILSYDAENRIVDLIREDGIVDGKVISHGRVIGAQG